MYEPPAQDDDDLDMEALKRYVEAGERRAAKGNRVSHWDAPNEFQFAQELMIVEELAKSLKEQGRAEIRDIEPNPVPNELPDCHARLDGKSIGIEVAEIIEPFEYWANWPLQRFRKKLSASIDKKDSKAGKPERAPALSRLHQLWLVIATDEPLLTPELIEEHLAWIRLTKPTNFDAVFVLGPREPRENAVVKGMEHALVDERARHTAFEVQWLAESQRPGEGPRPEPELEPNATPALFPSQMR